MLVTVDTYENFELLNLNVAEVEYKFPEDLQRIQEIRFLGEEITGNKKYSNKNLTKLLKKDNFEGEFIND